MLEHGGNLDAVVQRYNIPLERWLDLSTGINPNGWPVPNTLPASVWSELPPNNDELLSTAQHYYQCDSLMTVAGSQAAIQALPRLRAHSRVGILSPAYAEHARAWQSAGHEVINLNSETVTSAIDKLDVLVIINPNNPTGELFSKQQLQFWHNQLLQKGGWLIVDEAFIDVTPEQSLAALCPKPGLIVLRSIGKFFGLAGLRIGFVLAEPSLLQQLTNLLGPWPIAYASRYIANLAIADSDWQQQTRRKLVKQGQRLQQLLTYYGLIPTGDCSLFQWVKTCHSLQWHHQLAQQGVFSRLFTSPDSLRFGLPKTEQDWQRLEVALQTLEIRNAS